MDDHFKSDIIVRYISEVQARGSTQFYSPVTGTTLTLGSSGYYYHMKFSSQGQRNTDDTLSRFNLSTQAHQTLTDPDSTNIGSTNGYYYTFTTVINPKSSIRITIKGDEVLSIRKE